MCLLILKRISITKIKVDIFLSRKLSKKLCVKLKGSLLYCGVFKLFLISFQFGRNYIKASQGSKRAAPFFFIRYPGAVSYLFQGNFFRFPLFKFSEMLPGKKRFSWIFFYVCFWGFFTVTFIFNGKKNLKLCTGEISYFMPKKLRREQGPYGIHIKRLFSPKMLLQTELFLYFLDS